MSLHGLAFLGFLGHFFLELLTPCRQPPSLVTKGHTLFPVDENTVPTLTGSAGQWTRLKPSSVMEQGFLVASVVPIVLK